MIMGPNKMFLFLFKRARTSGTRYSFDLDKRRKRTYHLELNKHYKTVPHYPTLPVMIILHVNLPKRARERFFHFVKNAGAAIGSREAQVKNKPTPKKM